jgi:hypothetical protein
MTKKILSSIESKLIQQQSEFNADFEILDMSSNECPQKMFTQKMCIFKSFSHYCTFSQDF